MDVNDLIEVLRGAYGEVLEHLAVWPCIQALGVKPEYDNCLWHIRYKNIYGRGETLGEAAWDFYEKVNGHYGTERHTS